MRTTEMEIKRYIDNPDTRVVVYHNDEAGEWQWSVAVYDESRMITSSFWLDSFKTKREAMHFVKDNKLTLYSESA